MKFLYIIYTFLWKRFGIYLEMVINILNITAGSMMLWTPHEQKLVRYHSRIFCEADRAKKERERKAAVLWRYIFLPGMIELPILVGSNQCNLYGRFGGFTSTGAVFGLVICPCFTTWNSEYFPENQRMSPENWWLEDNIPFKMVPFFRGHLSFQGCSLCYTSTFAQIKPLEQ